VTRRDADAAAQKADNPAQSPRNRCRSHAFLLFAS
jgi:hypothetical protein